MVVGSAVALRILVALASLAAGVAVYALGRSIPPAILSPLAITRHALPAPAWFAGSAPAFLYTLALGLLAGTAAPAHAAARHCLAWTGLALCLELAQLPALAAAIAATLERHLPPALWHATAPYWKTGTFDPVDLAATVSAGLLALYLLSRPLAGAYR